MVMNVMNDYMGGEMCLVVSCGLMNCMQAGDLLNVCPFTMVLQDYIL